MGKIYITHLQHVEKYILLNYNMKAGPMAIFFLAVPILITVSGI